MPPSPTTAATALLILNNFLSENAPLATALLTAAYLIACAEKSSFLFYISFRSTASVSLSTCFVQAVIPPAAYLPLSSYCAVDILDLHLYSIFIMCCLVQFCYDGSTLLNKSGYYHTNWGSFVFMDLQLYLFSYLVSFLISTVLFGTPLV